MSDAAIATIYIAAFVVIGLVVGVIATARVRIAQARANAEHLQRYQQLADHAAASQRHAAEEVARLSERVGAIEKLLRDVGER